MDGLDKKYRVLVVGDVMLDSYMWGKVTGTSPEAPVPVVGISKREMRLGGAANVALNVLAMGSEAMLCGVIGSGDKSKRYFRLLEEAGLSKDHTVMSTQRKTTVKTRVISDNKHVLRVDEEDTHDLDQEIENEVIDRIAGQIEYGNVDAIILEDYNKGVLTPRVIEETIRMANEKGIPTTVDPKLKNFMSYKGCTLFKPNLKELIEGMDMKIDPSDLEHLESATGQLREKLGAKMVMTTLSQHGACINTADGFWHVPAHERNIVDVSGAGDTVISVATLALAGGMSANEIVAVSNLAGGLVCERAGVVSVNKEQLLQEASTI